VIAQNILVLSVGDEFLGFAGKTDMENLPNRANVSIAVTLEQAEIIMLVKQKGVLKYAIRPAGDMDINQTKNLQVSDLIKDANAQGGSSSISQDADKSKKEIMELLSKYNK
jgi:Flp pilus assembly protein CpaB